VAAFAAPAIEIGIAAGPVGWALLGVAAVGLGAYAVYEATQTADSVFSSAQPSATQPCPGNPATASDATSPPKDDPVPWVPWIPTEDETHPDHDDVDKARDIAKSETGDCDKLGWAIDALVRDLKFRRWDFQRLGGGDPDHVKPYRLRQDDLKRLIRQAKASGCPYNPEADDEANRGINYPTSNY
jgi:hypothetical protein